MNELQLQRKLKLANEVKSLLKKEGEKKSFTVMVAGSERHDGEKGYVFVVNAVDADDATQAILALQGRDDDDVILEKCVEGVPPANCGYFWNDCR